MVVRSTGTAYGSAYILNLAELLALPKLEGITKFPSKHSPNFSKTANFFLNDWAPEKHHHPLDRLARFAKVIVYPSPLSPDACASSMALLIADLLSCAS